MPKMHKKFDLPTKVCVACGLPFAWREAEPVAEAASAPAKRRGRSKAAA